MGKAEPNHAFFLETPKKPVEKQFIVCISGAYNEDLMPLTKAQTEERISDIMYNEGREIEDDILVYEIVGQVTFECKAVLKDIVCLR